MCRGAWFSICEGRTEQRTDDISTISEDHWVCGQQRQTRFGDGCSVCGNRCATLRVCGGCRHEKYCSITCQRSGWPGHAQICAERTRRRFALVCQFSIVYRVGIGHIGIAVVESGRVLSNTFLESVLSLKTGEDIIMETCNSLATTDDDTAAIVDMPSEELVIVTHVPNRSSSCSTFPTALLFGRGGKIIPWKEEIVWNSAARKPVFLLRPASGWMWCCLAIGAENATVDKKKMVYIAVNRDDI